MELFCDQLLYYVLCIVSIMFVQIIAIAVVRKDSWSDVSLVYISKVWVSKISVIIWLVTSFRVWSGIIDSVQIILSV